MNIWTQIVDSCHCNLNTGILEYDWTQNPKSPFSDSSDASSWCPTADWGVLPKPVWRFGSLRTMKSSVNAIRTVLDISNHGDSHQYRCHWTTPIFSSCTLITLWPWFATTLGKTIISTVFENRLVVYCWRPSGLTCSQQFAMFTLGVLQKCQNFSLLRTAVVVKLWCATMNSWVLDGSTVGCTNPWHIGVPTAQMYHPIVVACRKDSNRQCHPVIAAGDYLWLPTMNFLAASPANCLNPPLLLVVCCTDYFHCPNFTVVLSCCVCYL